MRVTNSMLVSNFMNNLNNSMGKLGKLQGQLASNRKYAHISDDPVSVIYSQQARYKLQRLELYQNNVSMAQSWLTQTETSLMELNKVLQAAYESCIDASTDVKGEMDRDIISKYMSQLRDQVLTVLNSTFGDKYVFGGYNTTGVVEGGTLQTPFSYMTVVNISAIDFSSAESEINALMATGSLSIGYTPPSGTISNADGSVPDISFSYEMDAAGTITFTATNGSNPAVTQTTTLSDINSTGPVELDFGDLGKITLENTDTVDLVPAPTYTNTVAMDSTDVENAFNTFLGTITNVFTKSPDGMFIPAPISFDVSFAGESGAEISFDSDAAATETDGNYTIGYETTGGKLKFYVQDAASGTKTYSNEEWPMDLAADEDADFVFTIPGYGTVTIDYKNGSTASAWNTNVPGQGAGGKLPVTSSATVQPEIPETKLSLPASAVSRKLTYNGIDMETTDPVERAILDQIAGQIPTYDIGPGSTMKVSENGSAVMTFGIPPQNIYNLLENLTRALENGASVEDINDFIKPIQDAQNHILSVVADVGGRSSRLELMASRYEQDSINYTQMKSDAEDADQAELIMNYKMAESVYQAALATGAYIIQPTLMDFLR